MNLVLVRHGLTGWNTEKRIQGRTDRPLSAAGIDQISARRLPDELHQLHWVTSPLLRARQTAELLGIKDAVVEPVLTEMDWGDWEGEILKPLRRQLGDAMRNNEARGLDFCPPNGESPRQVQQRIKQWLLDIAPRKRDYGAVVHKGIIRCIYAMSSGWDMRGVMPVQLDWNRAHVFQFSASGELDSTYRSIEL